MRFLSFVLLLLQLLEYGLHDDDIAKFGAVLDHIDLVQHGVLVQNVDDFLLGIVELNHRIGYECGREWVKKEIVTQRMKREW